MREVGACAGAVFEEACFADPQIHDAALVDEVVANRLDEAGMRLRVLVGALGLDQLAGLEIDIEVALARAVDAIGPMKAGVEPLRGSSAPPSGSPACSAARHRRPGRRLPCRNSRPSSPSRSRCRRDGRRPGGHRFQNRSARLPADRQGRLRRLRGATARTERCFLPPPSAWPERQPCGNISVPGCQRQPGKTGPGPECPRDGTQSSRPDCGSRWLRSEIQCLRKAIDLPWYSAARSAFSKSPLIPADSPEPVLNRISSDVAFPPASVSDVALHGTGY